LRTLGVIAALLAACSGLAGCADHPHERPLAEQCEDVRAGQSTSITFSTRPLNDAELASIAELSGLQTLQLDHDHQSFTSTGLTELVKLSELQHLRLRGAKIDGVLLEPILQFKHLRILNLPQADLSDAEFGQLATLPELVQLRMSSPRLTPAGLAKLEAFPALLRLHLIDVPVTDAGLAIFEKLPRLESLYLDGANVSDAALERLFRARPELHVHLNQSHHDRDPHRHPH